MIAPGKIADFMLLDSLDGIDPVVVYKKGECVYCKDEERAVRQKLRHAVSLIRSTTRSTAVRRRSPTLC